MLCVSPHAPTLKSLFDGARHAQRRTRATSVAERTGMINRYEVWHALKYA
jgi:hypothetical protein